MSSLNSAERTFYLVLILAALLWLLWLLWLSSKLANDYFSTLQHLHDSAQLLSSSLVASRIYLGIISKKSASSAANPSSEYAGNWGPKPAFISVVALR